MRKVIYGLGVALLTFSIGAVVYYFTRPKLTSQPVPVVQVQSLEVRKEYHASTVEIQTPVEAPAPGAFSVVIKTDLGDGEPGSHTIRLSKNPVVVDDLDVPELFYGRGSAAFCSADDGATIALINNPLRCTFQGVRIPPTLRDRVAISDPAMRTCCASSAQMAPYNYASVLSGRPDAGCLPRFGAASVTLNAMASKASPKTTADEVRVPWDFRAIQ